jgi:predicted nucleic acid-binding protein
MSPSYYLDANALWKFYQDQKGDVNVRRLVASSPSQVLISPLTMLEFLGVLMKYYRKRFIKRKQVHAVAGRLWRDAATGNVHRPFSVVQVPVGSFREAEGILLQYGNYDIQSNDALHLAIVLKLKTDNPVVLVTADNSLQITALRKGIDWYDPETGEQSK